MSASAQKKKKRKKERKKKILTLSQETHELKFPSVLPVVGWEEGGTYMPILGGAGRPRAEPETHWGIHCRPRKQRVRGHMSLWKELRNRAAD